MASRLAVGIEARSLVSTFVRAQARSDGSLDSSKDQGTLLVQILKQIADLIWKTKRDLDTTRGYNRTLHAPGSGDQIWWECVPANEF